MRVTRLSDLEMWADRVRAMGMVESIEMQLEEDVLISVPRSREALVNITTQLKKVMHQCYYLDQLLESTEIILREEKRLNLDLKVENHKYLEENAELSKTNRRLKQEIDKLVRDGRI
jgi:hypothetical protein